MFTRVAAGRARVVRELRAAGPLMAAVRAPVPARAPWLTAVLNHRSWRSLPSPTGARAVAVVVEAHRQGRPAAAAFLELRRRGPAVTVTLLGQDTAPLPPGGPALRLLAGDPASADHLAAGMQELLGSLRGPWTLRLVGLPLGDPTLRCLAAALPTSAIANERTVRLVDELDSLPAGPKRSRDPRCIERWLPALLDREPDPAARVFLRACGRLHAAIGQLELAVVAEGDRLRAALLTLDDGTVRWPWWGTTEIGGLRTEMGAPLVTLTARG
jgi:hypothetical protein